MKDLCHNNVVRLAALRRPIDMTPYRNSLCLLSIGLLVVLAACEIGKVEETIIAVPDEPDPPTVELSFPLAQDQLFKTQGPERILWTANDPDDGQTELLNISLDFSGDGGSDWSEIVTDTENDGSYLWDVSSLPEGDGYLVRVTAVDETDRSARAVSGGTFSVKTKAVITDFDGEDWDVTYAVKYYGWKVTRFRLGVGAYSIPPVNDPPFLSPGSDGYPQDTDIQDIVGTVVDGEARAYSIGALIGHEVVNDTKGSIHFSVYY